jgi:hypothetical protein
MAVYTVTYEVEFYDVASPREAAEIAQQIIANRESLAFTVTVDDDSGRSVHCVDLLEEEELTPRVTICDDGQPHDPTTHDTEVAVSKRPFGTTYSDDNPPPIGTRVRNQDLPPGSLKTGTKLGTVIGHDGPFVVVRSDDGNVWDSEAPGDLTYPGEEGF